MRLDRTAMYAVAMLAALSVPGTVMSAQPVAFPTKPIRLIVGYAPGGPNDIIARMLSQKLPDRLGQPVVIDNRPGADSIIGTEMVARAAPDGHTLVAASSSHTIHPSVYTKLPYDVMKDFAPVTVVASTGYVLVVHPGVAAGSVRELVDLAKAKPGQLSYASTGAGGANHLSTELFSMMTGIRVVHVPYKGGAPAMGDLMGGHVQFMFSAMAPALPQVKAGRVRALAVTGAKRAPAVPDLPTVAEAGVAGYEVNGWYGIMAPAGTPAAAIRRLNEEIATVMRLPDIGERLAAIGVEAVGNRPEAMRDYMRAEIAKWAQVAKNAGVLPGAVQ